MKTVFVVIFLAFLNLNYANGQGINNVPKSIGTDPVAKSSKSRPYPRKLSEMDEEPLSKDTSKNEVYRLKAIRWMLDPTFKDTSKNEVHIIKRERWVLDPVVIRIEMKNDSYVLLWKEYRHTDKIEPYKIIVDTQKVIDKVTWDSFKSNLDKINFWKMDSKPQITVIGFDGETWTLEGKKNNDYHYVNRWGPNSRSDFFRCCLYIVSLTGMKIDRDGTIR